MVGNWATRNLSSLQLFCQNSRTPHGWSITVPLQIKLSCFRILGGLKPAVEENSIKDWKQGSWRIFLQPYTKASSAAYASLLRGCLNVKDGKRIHDDIVKEGFERGVYLGSLLLHMYLKCEAVGDALALFANMSDRNVFSWNFVIQEYARHGQGREPLQLFNRMQQEGVMPNKITFLSVIDACANEATLLDGERIRACVVENGFELDVVFGTVLISMYGSCGRLSDASAIFENLLERDVVAWTTMISITVQHGKSKRALQLFHQMQQEGVVPSKFTFVSFLAACAKHAALAEGEEMHARILANRFELDVIVGNALVNMYGKCGKLEDAHDLFDQMPERNIVSWTSMIALYSQNGYGKAALMLFNRMHCEGVVPNKVTFVNILCACATMAVLDEGKRVHARIRSSEFDSDVVVGTALVNLYGKFGNLGDARKVFDDMHHQDLVLWNAMIAVYAQNRHGSNAIWLFEEMQGKQITPDKVTFVNILAACANCLEETEGERMHAYIVESGLELEVVVGNALVHMYGRCRNLSAAQRIFDKMTNRDVVSWTVLISGYVLQGEANIAFLLYTQMQKEGILPDKVTVVSILDTCTGNAALRDCHQIHANVMEHGFDLDAVVGNALVNMYANCGELQDAQRIFDLMPEWDVIAWNVIIEMYAKHRHGSEALEVFEQMLEEGVKPSKVTFVCMLSACASEALFIEGKWVHSCIIDCGCEFDVIVATALLTMYGNCGSLEQARKMFEEMPERNLFSWNAMIAVYAHHGQGKEALQLLLKMQKEGAMPDTISFVGVLAACSHAGLVDEACKVFTSMTEEYSILPASDHYVLMVNLLGRAGQLEVADKLIYSMPHQPLAVQFMTMLGACVYKHDLDQGEHLTNHVLELDPYNAASYVMLSNIYAAVGKDVNATLPINTGNLNKELAIQVCN